MTTFKIDENLILTSIEGIEFINTATEVNDFVFLLPKKIKGKPIKRLSNVRLKVVAGNKVNYISLLKANDLSYKSFFVYYCPFTTTIFKNSTLQFGIEFVADFDQYYTNVITVTPIKIEAKTDDIKLFLLDQTEQLAAMRHDIELLYQKILDLTKANVAIFQREEEKKHG